MGGRFVFSEQHHSRPLVHVLLGTNPPDSSPLPKQGTTTATSTFERQSLALERQSLALERQSLALERQSLALERQPLALER